MPVLLGAFVFSFPHSKESTFLWSEWLVVCVCVVRGTVGDVIGAVCGVGGGGGLLSFYGSDSLTL